MKKKTPVTEQADGGSAGKSNSQVGKGPGLDIGQQAEPGGGTAAALFKLKGKVLVVGGYDQFDKPLFTAELFDPGTGTWASTGSLFHERAGHGATLLLDGKVLVSGGSSNDKSVEVYNPATGEWFSVGRLLAPRNYTTATLLQNGRVLIAGGGAELYDPATMVWTLTGNPKNPRFLHTATRLHNGKVLIVGGSPIESGGFSNTAELYDPATGLWNPTGNLFFDRFGHTATLLRDGKVLVTGGYRASVADSALDGSEVYNPATGEWFAVGRLNAARKYHTATLLQDGKVLVAGGLSADQNILNSAEVYNPDTLTWARTRDLNEPRIAHTATLLTDGKVLVAGGSNTAELYDPFSGTWSTTGSLSTTRGYHSATLIGTTNPLRNPFLSLLLLRESV